MVANLFEQYDSSLVRDVVRNLIRVFVLIDGVLDKVVEELAQNDYLIGVVRLLTTAELKGTKAPERQDVKSRILGTRIQSRELSFA